MDKNSPYSPVIKLLWTWKILNYGKSWFSQLTQHHPMGLLKLARSADEAKGPCQKGEEILLS